MANGEQRGAAQVWSVCCWEKREPGMETVWISKKLNIASSTANESALRERQIVDEHILKLLDESKSENPRNVP